MRFSLASDYLVKASVCLILKAISCCNNCCFSCSASSCRLDNSFNISFCSERKNKRGEIKEHSKSDTPSEHQERDREIEIV